MPRGKSIKTFFYCLNLFIPGSINLYAGCNRLGTVIVSLSFLNFFLIPYLSISTTKIMYISLLIVSYGLFFKKRSNTVERFPLKLIIILTASFFALSIFSLIFTHNLSDAKQASGKIKKNGEIIYVLGTKPFKTDSMQKMLKMSDDELFDLFENNIHPFFRRLKVGLEEASNNSNHRLLISAGKNQKKISQKILKRVNEEATFFSCTSTKEEVNMLKDYLDSNSLDNVTITIVSDDYHAFRALLYSKLSDIKNKDIQFWATSYEYSFFSYIKILFIEQLLFLLSYFSLLINLFFI